MIKKSISCFFITALFLLTAVSCKGDEEITKTPVAEKYLTEARNIMKDCIVVNAKAMMGTVDKTLLPQGCPLKYYLTWKDERNLKMEIRAFSVGKMPLTITFAINLNFIQLNSWEKNEYQGEGWIKFQGEGGVTDYIGNPNTEYEGDSEHSGGGSVIGYLNVKTHEVEFITNFNVMNFSSDVYRQKIDPTRINRYDAEFAQYEKDLEKYKKEHGIL